MKSLAAMIALVFLCACSSGGPTDNSDNGIHADSAIETINPDGNVGPDAPDFGAGDTTADQTGTDLPDTLVADAGDDGAPDIATPPETCEETLKDWMCRTGDCGDGRYCSGYAESCAEPPCFGAFCDYFPGSCIAQTRKPLCSSAENCGPWYSCVKRQMSAVGICVRLGSTGLCMNDEDCSTGMVCAGEVRCGIGNPCLGPEYPGICLNTLPSGSCWDDGMCPSGRCDGARLCRLGDDNCTPTAGTCITGASAGCSPVGGGTEECSGSPWGNWCTGAETTNLEYCQPPPASTAARGECWEDSACGLEEGRVCHSSGSCPPGAYCRVDGFHSGVCGPAPAAGQEIEFGFADQTDDGKIVLSTTSLAYLINRSPVAIYLPPCETAAVYVQRNGVWDNVSMPWTFGSHECGSSAQSDKTLLRIPPGSGLVLKMAGTELFNTGLAGRTIRLSLRYWLGCIPGGTIDDGMKCRELSVNLGRTLDSPAVDWVLSL